jgi:hypothetical protein
MTTPEGGTPTVITVSRLSQFHCGLGQTLPHDGKLDGCLGEEVKERQMHPLMKLLDALLLCHQALAMRELGSLSKEEVDVWYGEEPENPQVPRR